MGPAAIIKEGSAESETPRVFAGKRLGGGALLGLCLSLTLSASAAPPGTTFTLSQGVSDIGLLSPYRHGLLNDLQISAYPDKRLSNPNITLSKAWGNIRGWQLTSRHELNAPSLSLSSSTCQGSCSLNSTSPQLLNLNSQFYLSHQFARAVTVTPSIGLEVNAGDLSSTELGPLGILFNPFHSGYSINTGIDVSGYFGSNWGYAANVEYFSVATAQASDPILGHKAMLFYEWDKHRRISLGYQYTNGLYHYQYEDRAYPMLDFLWSLE